MSNPEMYVRNLIIGDSNCCKMYLTFLCSLIRRYKYCINDRALFGVLKYLEKTRQVNHNYYTKKPLR